MSTVTVTVTGMTCGHCVSSVREEAGSIPGVTAVDVDLANGKGPSTADAWSTPTRSRVPLKRPAISWPADIPAHHNQGDTP